MGEMKWAQDLWPGMEMKHAALLWMMGWRPYEHDDRIASAQCRTVVYEGEMESSLTLPSTALRDAARALEEAASWLERRKSMAES